MEFLKKIPRLPREAWYGLLIAVLIVSSVVQAVRINHITVQLSAAETKVSELENALTKTKEYGNQTAFELDKLKGSVAIIDGAVNAEGKRKQRILKVKNLIRDIAVADNLREAQALEPSQLSEMASAIVDRADAEHIPVALLMGLIRQESAFNPEAVSKKGAQGLTQVMPTTADDIKQWTQRSYYEPFRISHNVQFGAYYLGRMMRKFGWDKSKAIMAYNGGPEAVASWAAGVGKLWPETIDYEKQVMEYAKKYESMGAI